ncbi:MAG: hypothetical protein KY467_11265 [Gemmatimonadetes bacterium]|nr:hypothetical protein [Gemmatimonadota bacterium]
MRMNIAGIPAVLLLAGTLACGGDEVPPVDGAATADTEIFTDSPDTVGVPVAGQGGTMADSVRPGTPGTPAQNESDVGQQP